MKKILFIIASVICLFIFVYFSYYITDLSLPLCIRFFPVMFLILFIFCIYYIFTLETTKKE